MFVPKIIVCLAALTTLASALPSSQHAGAVDNHVTAMADNVIEAIAANDFPTARALYDVIKQNGYLDACAFELASSMKQAMLSLEFEQLSPESKAEFEDLKMQLPSSVKNAVFATTVCFHNLNYNEYLFSPNNDFIYNDIARNVFLWHAGGKVNGSTWTLESTFSEVDFKIANMYGEYLYGDESHYYINRRQVFTYRSQWPGTNTNVWRFQSLGNDVVISNLWYAGTSTTREYLYASSSVYNYDANRRRVFDWDSEWITDMTHIWRIEEC